MIKPYWPYLELAPPARGFAEDYSRALRRRPPEVVMAAGQEGSRDTICKETTFPRTLGLWTGSFIIEYVGSLENKREE
jgi:hypothetical protein